MLSMLRQRIKKLGAKILYFRKIRGLTQEQLAERVGITSKYLSRIETGNYPNCVSLSTLMIIADKLSVHTSELLKDIED